MKFAFLFISLVSNIYAIFIGNPLDPTFYQEGLISNCEKTVSMRAGYVQEFIYKGTYKDEFINAESTPLITKLSTYAGILTFNFLNRLDLYGILGNTNIQLDRDVFEKRRISWGIGTKATLYKRSHFAIGVDAKYFQVKFKPRYFVVSESPAPTLTSFSLEYTEAQGAVAISYEGQLISPYIGATYLFSRITPCPHSVLVEIPNQEEVYDLEMKTAINRKRWGMVIGASILGSKKMTLNLESRVFDQNGVNITGELRF